MKVKESQIRKVVQLLIKEVISKRFPYGYSQEYKTRLPEYNGEEDIPIIMFWNYEAGSPGDKETPEDPEGVEILGIHLSDDRFKEIGEDIEKNLSSDIIEKLEKGALEQYNTDNSHDDRYENINELKLKKVKKQVKLSKPPTKVKKAGGKVPSVNSHSELPANGFPEYQTQKNSGKQHPMTAYDEVWEGTEQEKKCKSKKSKMAEDILKEFIRKSVREQLNRNELQTEDSSYGTFYHPISTNDGQFLKSYASRTLKRSESVYKLEYLDQNGSNIEFSFITDDPSTVGRALRSPDNYIDPACSSNSTDYRTATRIENIAPGKAQKTEDGNWRITTKAKIHIS